MEESLKRLKAARGTSATGGNQGMTDDDKIRLQLTLDVKEFGQQVNAISLWFPSSYSFTLFLFVAVMNIFFIELGVNEWIVF